MSVLDCVVRRELGAKKEESVFACGCECAYARARLRLSALSVRVCVRVCLCVCVVFVKALLLSGSDPGHCPRY